MPRQSLTFFLAIGVILAATTASGATPTAAGIRLFYTANRQGEIELCHCVDNQSGGLERLANFLDLERTSSVGPSFWGDAGDTFFSMPHLNPTLRAEEILRAKMMAEAFAQMKLDAFTPGERDLADGVDTLKDLQRLSGAVFLTSNLLDRSGSPLFEPFHIFQVGKWKVGVLGLMDDHIDVKEWGLRIQPPLEALKTWLPKLKGADVVVLLSHVGLTQDRELTYGVKGMVPPLDMIWGSHSMDVLAKPELGGSTRIVQTDTQGRDIGEWTWAPGHPESSTYRLVELTEKYAGKNRETALSEELKRKVHALGEKTVFSSVDAGPHYVANAYSCRSCHRAQYDFWAGTKHAAAYLVLYAKNEHFDPECIGCHSLGFGESAGFGKVAEPIELKKNLTDGKPFVETLMKKIFSGDKGGDLDSRRDPERYAKLHARYISAVSRLEAAGALRRVYIGVQCENCHGNREAHPGPLGIEPHKVDLQTCRGCHRAPNAPDFDPSMLARVACPLMKRIKR